MRNLSLVKKLCVFSFVAVCFVLFSVSINAQTLLVNYDFASAVAGTPCAATALTTATGVTANFTTGGTGGGTCTTPVGTAAASPPAFTANAINQAVSLTSFASTSTNWFQFQLSGVSSYQDYMLYFNARRSGTGPQNVDVQYSLDGMNFTTFSTIQPPNATFATAGASSAFTVDLSTVAAIEGQPTVYFRLLGRDGTGSAGTFVIDNFQVQAQTTSFSGEAVGVIANANIGGVVTTNARVADTGPLPDTGGSLDGSVATATVLLDADPSLNSRITTDAITTMTSGGTAGSPNSSQSSATVNNLAVNLLADTVGGAAITATTVKSTSNCTCGSNGPTCSGTTTIENLTVNKYVIYILDVNGGVTSMPPPNTVLSPEITGVAGLTITLNEQTSNGSGDITVNAIHIVFRDPAGLLIADIIVAQSHSDITCSSPTAAGATINGRITDSRGRGLQRVVVMMTGGGIEEPIYATTSAFGYYRFEDVPAGNTYILTASSIRYTFEQPTIVINVGGDFSVADFIGQNRFIKLTDLKSVTKLK